MKRIAVSQRVDYLKDRHEKRDALDQNLVKFLQAIDCLAFPVPNVLPTATSLRLWLKHVQPDGILLSGGNDIGQEPSRDQIEHNLLEFAGDSGCPVLGICRGMQVLAVHHGAHLTPINHHVRTRHQLAGPICGEANSFHGQKISHCPDNFQILATSEDGTIEAIGHQYLPFEGWMWHPEREDKFMQRDLERAQCLFANISNQPKVAHSVQ